MDGQPHWRERLATPAMVSEEFAELLLKAEHGRPLDTFGFSEIMALHRQACRNAGEKAQRLTNA